MIIIKSPFEIERIRTSCAMLAKVHELAEKKMAIGMTTFELDRFIHKEINSMGGTPSFYNYEGFPAASCISLNEVVVHGIPSKDIIIQEGDIVSLDIGVYYEGFHSDAARTHPAGVISEEDEQLIRATRESFYHALTFCKEGNRVSDISHAVESYIRPYGYGIVEALTGHGVGSDLHEEPMIPNFGRPGRGPRIRNNMVFAIEPMINLGTHEVYVDDDGWTIRTGDGRKSAHYENTVLVCENGPEILTLTSGETYEK